MARPHHEPHLPPPPGLTPMAGAARPRAAIIAQARADNHQRAATAPALMVAGAGIHDSAPELRVLPQMPIQGHSGSTVALVSSAVNSFNKFLATPAAQHKYGGLGATLDALPMVVVCHSAVFREFAYFLSNGGLRSATGGAGASVIEYLRKVFNVLKGKWRSANPDFFATADDEWLKGLTREVHVEAFHDANGRGTTVSKQAVPMSLQQRREVIRGLMRVGNAEAAMRAAVLQINHVATGRPCEVACLSPDILAWDSEALCAVASWPQMKTHKHKLAVLISGIDRHCCPVLALAVAYATAVFREQLYDADCMNYFFPKLASPNRASASTSSSSTITNWLRQQAKGSRNSTFGTPRAGAPSLPPTVTAGSQRTGAINSLALGGVSDTFAMFNSGHDCDQGLSRLWHYMGATTPLVIPGARVLCGWRAPPTSQLGRAPVPPSFAYVLDAGHDAGKLEEFIDEALYLRPRFVHPEMLSDGQLRPFVHAMAATLVMYYDELCANGEACVATARAKSTLHSVGMATSAADEAGS